MDERGFESMNVIPLVDVMLVLLTIVLMTSTFIAVGAIPVSLPKADGESVEHLRTTTIEIDENARIYCNSEEVSVEVLEARLTGISTGMPVLIRADKKIALQVFVDVMNIVKGLGFQKVSLQTEKSV